MGGVEERGGDELGGGGLSDGRLVVSASGNTGRLYLDPPHVPALSCVGLSSRADWPGSETVK